ncbi:MAG: hypothetical protein ACKVOX_04280 [Rhizobacter sp.]
MIAGEMNTARMTSQLVIVRLNAALNAVRVAPGLQARFQDLGLVPRPGAPQAWMKQVVVDLAWYRRAIERARIKLE